MRYETVTLGCKVNQYETQLMREALGPFWSEAGPGEPADLVVVNTCSVTAEADREARRALRRARRRHPAARIVAAGCLARRPGVDLAAEGLADAVVAAPAAEALLAAAGLPPRPAPEGGNRITRFDGRARAFVKVQDGCDRRCAFCVIPLIRGGSVSRPLAEVVEEARGLVRAGAPEIVLCGVRLNAWRDPASGAELHDLVAALVAWPDLPRLRLSSLYPGRLAPALVRLVTMHPKICKHLHLPIQSGSDAILKAMRRGYTAARIEANVAELRAGCPDLGLTADVLVGFPGETEADAEATERLVERCGFHKLHLFPFSARPGTPAAALEPVPAAVVEARMDRLRAIEARLRAASLAARVGRVVEAVVESRDRDGTWRAVTGEYHPVRLAVPPAAPGGVVRVRVTGVERGALTGVPA